MDIKTYAIQLTFICGEDIKKYFEDILPLTDVLVNFSGLDNKSRIISVGAVKIEEIEEVPTKLDLCN